MLNAIDRIRAIDVLLQGELSYDERSVLIAEQNELYVAMTVMPVYGM